MVVKSMIAVALLLGISLVVSLAILRGVRGNGRSKR